MYRALWDESLGAKNTHGGLEVLWKMRNRGMLNITDGPYVEMVE